MVVRESMLSVSSLIALWALPVLMLQLNFVDILLTVDVVLLVFKHFWIVSSSFSDSAGSTDSQCSTLLSNALRSSFDFDFCESFCSSRFGVTIIALNAISFRGESCRHLFISLETSSINFLPTFPDGSKKRFFF